jgi:hypothetical protein
MLKEIDIKILYNSEQDLLGNRPLVSKKPTASIFTEE